jgi:hypothetical protein
MCSPVSILPMHSFTQAKVTKISQQNTASCALSEKYSLFLCLTPHTILPQTSKPSWTHLYTRLVPKQKGRICVFYLPYSRWLRFSSGTNIRSNISHHLCYILVQQLMKFISCSFAFIEENNENVAWKVKEFLVSCVHEGDMTQMYILTSKLLSLFQIFAFHFHVHKILI